MSKIISFIIPSYNVERYLTTALTSFITDNKDLNKQIEVIVVDDGSKDGTADIARTFISRYPDMYRLIQKENGGHGSTINVGSREAQGKYFKVIDADDWVVTENLPEYLRFLERSDADAVLTPFHMVDMATKERIVQKMYSKDYSKLYTAEELAGDWKSFDRCTTFHGITYRTEFYNRYRHELPEKVFYEDQEYATIPFCHAERIALLDLMVYQYLVGNSEQSVAKSNQIKRIGHLEAVISHMLSYWEQHCSDLGFAKQYFLRKLESVVLSHYVVMCIKADKKRDGHRRCRALNRKLKNHCPLVYQMVRKKYMVYVLFSLLGISEESYEKLIHSSVFRLIRHNHEIEKE